MGLFPISVGGNSAQLIPRIGHCFERAILCMRTACLKGHHESLPGRVHDAVADLETRLVQPGQYVEAYTCPRIGTGRAPLALSRPGCRQQRVDVRFRITNAEREPKGRALIANRLAGCRLIQIERPVQVSFEGGLAIRTSRFTVHFGTRHFGKRAPVATCCNGGERLIKRRFVLRE